MHYLYLLSRNILQSIFVSCSSIVQARIGYNAFDSESTVHRIHRVQYTTDGLAVLRNCAKDWASIENHRHYLVSEVVAQCNLGGVLLSSLDATSNGCRLVHNVFCPAPRIFSLYGCISQDAVPSIEFSAQHGIFQQSSNLRCHVAPLQSCIQTKQLQHICILLATAKLRVDCLEGAWLFLLKLQWRNELFLYFDDVTIEEIFWISRIV